MGFPYQPPNVSLSYKPYNTINTAVRQLKALNTKKSYNPKNTNEKIRTTQNQKRTISIKLRVLRTNDHYESKKEGLSQIDTYENGRLKTDILTRTTKES